MRSFASSTNAERAISSNGSGRSGAIHLPDPSRSGSVCASVWQSDTPSDQRSAAGNNKDSGAAKGAASVQADDDSPADRMRSDESLTWSPIAWTFDGFSPPWTRRFSCRKSKVSKTGASIPRVSSGVSARCGNSCPRSSSASSVTIYKHGEPSITHRPERRIRNRPGCENFAASCHRASCIADRSASSGISLMAASPFGSEEVRNTAEFCVTPNSLRSGNRPSANWPIRCCTVSGMGHRQIRARNAARRDG